MTTEPDGEEGGKETEGSAARRLPFVGPAVGPAAGPAVGPAAGPAPSRPLGLWEGFGVEIELMIVDRETLDVRPVADRLFELHGWAPDADDEPENESDAGIALAGAGEPPEASGAPDEGGSPSSPDPTPQIDAASDLVVEGVGWSNEVALHVLELKTSGPIGSLEHADRPFQKSVRRANDVLDSLGCRLLPGGMHPWMDPGREFRIWPHEYTEVYRTFDRIFGCRGHGWANLQSTHVNLPFCDDREFRLLHDAVRLVLPLIPAIAASSPILEGRVGPVLDNRMAAYRNHARQVPSVTGAVVPDSANSEDEYRTRVLEPLYRDLASLDPDGVLRHEWVNARGAIPRFGRGSVEIRVIDAQESPRMDLAVVAAVTAVVRRAAAGLEEDARGSGPGLRTRHPTASTEELSRLLERTVRAGRRAALDRPLGALYRDVLDLASAPGTVGELWEDALAEGLGEWTEPLQTILLEGTLAERILADLGLEWPGSAGTEIPPSRLHATYRKLADALARGGTFGR